MYSTLYELYVDHVKDEIKRLTQVENYSLTWAANNAITLVPFGFRSGAGGDAVLPNELRDRMKGLPIYIVEKNGRRTNVNFNELAKEEVFWTVDCQLVRSAEQLVRETKSNSTVSDLVKALNDSAQELPSNTVLYNLDISSMLRDSVELEFEPHEIKANESLRRVDIRWGERTSEHWIRVQELMRRAPNSERRDVRVTDYLDHHIRGLADRRTGSPASNKTARQLWLAYPKTPFSGIDEYSGVISQYRIFLRGDIPIAAFLRDLSPDRENQDSVARLQIFSTVFLTASDAPPDEAFSYATTQLRHIAGDLGEDYTVGSEAFLEALRSSPLRVFDTSVWTNRRFEFFE
ncbi:hypothetical protein [Bradyrhizobium sp. Ash2021]|uniref:hypothetical protein n=1 Tax=Bradyrhizobium sp. Ash2021 TaxID=2954771 RepID=UPI0028158EE3|nr:hypothetical protein [Bradyrhizobium sp. Ash2021]WMT73810.1 hypothetical protein NL528_38770 [Bradyrhizobium sp. Ash2021]